jgi:hypothetical protein
MGVIDPAALAAQAQEAKQRAEAATSGPWTLRNEGIEEFYAPFWRVGEEILVFSDDTLPAPPDAVFIAHARTDLPDLAEAVLALLAERETLREKLRLIEEFCESHLPLASEKSEVVARRVLWAIRGSNENPPHPDRAALAPQEPANTCPECGEPAVTDFGDGRFMCRYNGHIWTLAPQEPTA